MHVFLLLRGYCDSKTTISHIVSSDLLLVVYEKQRIKYESIIIIFILVKFISIQYNSTHTHIYIYCNVQQYTSLHVLI